MSCFRTAEDVALELHKTLRECEARAIVRVQQRQHTGERTMAQLVPEPTEFLPFAGADYETVNVKTYDLWLRTAPGAEWVFGCACHSPVAAWTCMRYVRSKWPGITVKVKAQCPT